MAKNDELIAKLEMARGPDTNLDDEIAVALGKKTKSWKCDACGTFYSSFVQDYTRSVDAAMTLLPADHFWTLDGYQEKTPSGFSAQCAESQPYHGVDSCTGATPAIAICIAALKAVARIPS